MPASMSAAEERAAALHRLAEVMQVVLFNLGPLQAALESLRYLPGIGGPALTELGRALAILGDVRAATRDCGALFDSLRRVV